MGIQKSEIMFLKCGFAGRMLKFELVLTVLFCALLISCQSKKQNKAYLFLGHCYQWGVKENNRIDYRLKGFEFKKYDQIWLGGDLTARTNEKVSTLNYLDSIFDLSAARTHWAVGNHDIKHGALSQIEEVTMRKTYYSTSFDGIHLLVLNTNEFHHPAYHPKPHECEMLEGQLLMLANIEDTIQTASHLVILHHHALLTDSLTKDSIKVGHYFNLYHNNLRVDCENKHTFESKIYPLLQSIQNKGIQVVLVSGDLGQRSKSFEYRTEDGIWFLGSGINNSLLGKFKPAYVTDTSPDKVLIFDHDIDQRKLTWRFEYLENLLSNLGTRIK